MVRVIALLVGVILAGVIAGGIFVRSHSGTTVAPDSTNQSGRSSTGTLSFPINAAGASTAEWSIRTSPHSPVQLLVTDPSGNKTGYVSGSGVRQNIPDAVYTISGGIADPSGVNPPLPSTPTFIDENALVGTYQVQVIGTGSGPYTLDFEFTDASGKTTVQTVHGTAQSGSVDNFQVQVGPDTIQQR